MTVSANLFLMVLHNQFLTSDMIFIFGLQEETLCCQNIPSSLWTILVPFFLHFLNQFNFLVPPTTKITSGRTLSFGYTIFQPLFSKALEILVWKLPGPPISLGRCGNPRHCRLSIIIIDAHLLFDKHSAFGPNWTPWLSPTRTTKLYLCCCLKIKGKTVMLWRSQGIYQNP